MLLGTVWFCIVAVMMALYVVFDGFDLGAGIAHLWVARTGDERRSVLRSIGPVWDGNEVWLLAGGGALYLAFPSLYATGFSGFYLPLMVVLWILILRAISLEFRKHLAGPVWPPFFDAVFALSSALIAIVLGAALGNVVRGVPLDEAGSFFEPLWTDFGIGPPTGILDWFTVLSGLLAFFTLGMHGALWVALKTEGAVQGRSRRMAAAFLWGVLGLAIVVTIAAFLVQPRIPASFAARPWGALFPVLALASLAGVFHFLRRRNDLRAFLSSCAMIVFYLVSVVFGLYPLVLPANTDPARSLTIEGAMAPEYGLRVALVWWAIGMVLVTIWFTYVYRRFAGKVTLEGEGY